MVTKRAKKQTAQAVDKKSKDFLTEGEMKRLLDAAKGSRYGARDHLILLMTYRHGLRVSELIDLSLKDLDLDTSRLYVRRKKGSLSTHQPIEGDELRALRAWLRERSLRPDARSPYLFLSERGPFTRQAVNYIVSQAGKRAKLPSLFTHTCCVTRQDSISLTRDSTPG
jgi:integrase